MLKTEYVGNDGFLQRDGVEHKEYAEALSTENQENKEKDGADLLEKVLDIESEQPLYRTGGTGKDGTCDCIGAVMGAMYRLGCAAYPLHSSNYFARYQTEELCEIADPAALKPGQVVYKAKDDPSGLHERYLPGGSYCTGDTRDYYHAGVVVSASPLIIVHCTSSGNVNGFTRDERIGQWRFAGKVKGVFSF